MQDRRFLTIPETCAKTGLCRSLIYQGAKDGTFVAYVKVGRKTLFDSSEVEAWMDAQLQARDAGKVGAK